MLFNCLTNRQIGLTVQAAESLAIRNKLGITWDRGRSAPAPELTDPVSSFLNSPNQFPLLSERPRSLIQSFK